LRGDAGRFSCFQFFETENPLECRIMAESTRPGDVKYTQSHEWVRIEGEEGVIGITDFAVEHLKDLTFLELPDVGSELEAGESFGVIESVKAAADLNAPVGGEVLEVNEEAVDNFDLLKESPFEAGWLVKVKLSDPSEADALLGLEAYEEQVRKEEAEM
jgi:glycine cleavage system H protein